MAEQCKACYGTGRVTCLRCYGSGYVGRGETGRRIRCQACDGTGRVECTECRGTGVAQERRPRR